MLSIGNNRKLGKKVALFNLPQGKTCPGKTAYCKEICYAKKSERVYPSARKSRENNYIASKKKDFIDKINVELRKKKVKIARVHESGDFYNQQYLEKWMVIWRVNPNIKFLAFTKSFHLDFSEVPENVAIYWSIDHTSKNIPQDETPHARTIESMEDVKFYKERGWRYCGPVGKTKKDPKKKDPKNYNYCGEKCKYCWTKRSHVVWLKH